jgi:hypothetical protein
MFCPNRGEVAPNFTPSDDTIVILEHDYNSGSVVHHAKGSLYWLIDRNTINACSSFFDANWLENEFNVHAK